MKPVILLFLVLTAVVCSQARALPIEKENQGVLHEAFTSEHAVEDAVQLALGVYLPWASKQSQLIAQQLKACTVENHSTHIRLEGLNCPLRYEATHSAAGSTKQWQLVSAALANALGLQSYEHEIQVQQSASSAQLARRTALESATYTLPNGQRVTLQSQFIETYAAQGSGDSRVWKIVGANVNTEFTFMGLTYNSRFWLINTQKLQSESCLFDQTKINCAALAQILGWDAFHNPFNE